MQARQWLRPLLAAKKRFILVLPPEGEEEHPIRQLLLLLMPALKKSCLHLDADDVSPSLAELSVPLNRIDLPETSEFIEIGAPVAFPKERQSYTSLAELFDNPALFHLKRVAKLSGTQVMAAEENNKLLGTLAHRVIERLFEREDVLGWASEKAVEWFRSTIDRLLLEEGAPLLMLGAGVSQQRFKGICEKAIVSLLDRLRAAGARKVETEVKFDGSFGAVPLTGKVDLLIELADSRVVALDMKWRDDKRFVELLRSGNYLQLALYAMLVEQNRNTPPAALGYFIFESGAMYITAPDVMPGALVREPRNDVSAQELLRRASESWKWRAEQMKKGRIDIVVKESLAQFQGPQGTLPVEGSKPWHKEHLILLGGWDK
ncbi:PD-(D/E)XK nuclease family protein [Cupriavidus consociatus]|uniref:PD-(D/E)XK nuclease family protein n=1 Tax=Cupriavidus consociatus TaxID=2821357 RepID=UPI001AE4447B|nr:MULTISPECIES: PD-(D/E)XK nuclease family protein [unclassified Cupriavidus]MBP0625317.1 PD-(D/E)XK nuclease family protein [Cupriavidus sp. LEh25]MDK2662053.1 PD-(D/E)XK nuclease family protein [Cupriavidus sp. LEh21]